MMKPVYEPEYNKAKSLLRNSDPENARSIVQKRVEDKGETPEYLLLLGVADFMLDRNNSAKNSLTKVYYSGHERYKTAYYLGLCMENERDFEDAVHYLKESNRLKPDYKPAVKKLQEYNITPVEPETDKSPGWTTGKVRNIIRSFFS